MALALDEAPLVQSALSSNGVPLQYCRSWSRQGSHLRALADPATDRTGSARFAKARVAVERVFEATDCRDLLPLALRLLDVADASESRHPDGLCWIGASLEGPGAAMYVDARNGTASAAPSNVRAFARAVLEDCEPLERLLQALPAQARLLCVGIEGTNARRARFKLYWRLAEMVSLSSFGDPLFDDPIFATFATAVIGEREIRAKGIVACAGFALDGSRTDVKLDICGCGGCAHRCAGDWQALVRELSTKCDVAVGDVTSLLALGEVSSIGFGLTRLGERRINLYVMPDALP